MARWSGLLVILLATGRAAGDEPVYVAAARSRGGRYESVEVSFSVKETVAAGAISGSLPMTPKGKTLPETETVLTSTNRLVLHGARARYENNHPLWAPERGALLRPRLVNVSGGEANKSLYTVGLNNPDVPEGFIHRETNSQDLRSSLLVPLMFHLRGADRARSPLQAADLRPTGSKARLGGRDCDEYTRTDGTASVTRVWLDAGADYVLRKYRRETSGRPDEQHDMTYRQTPDGHPAPERWVRQTFAPDGTVRVSTEVEVTRFESGPAPAPETFVVEFPPRARVYDGRSDKWYVVQADGLMREFSVTSGQELDSVVDQSGRGWFERYRAALVWAVAGVVVVLAVWFVRRRRQASAVSPP